MQSRVLGKQGNNQRKGRKVLCKENPEEKEYSLMAVEEYHHSTGESTYVTEEYLQKKEYSLEILE